MIYIHSGYSAPVGGRTAPVGGRANPFTNSGYSRLVEARTAPVGGRAIPFGHWARRGQDHPDTSRRDKSELVEVGLEVTRTNTRLGDSLQLSAWAPWP